MTEKLILTPSDFKNFLMDFGLFDENVVIEDNIIGQSRWNTKHEIIFKFQGQYWRTEYEVGSTESQLYNFDDWLDDQKEIVCVEVKQVEKLVKVWEEA